MRIIATAEATGMSIEDVGELTLTQLGALERLSSELRELRNGR